MDIFSNAISSVPFGQTGTRQQKSTHQYQPLEPGKHDLRVLTIEPSLPVNRIRCTLRNMSLADATADDGFKALSYCWGPSSRRRTAILDGTRVSVTDNLYAAMHQLRRHNKPVMIWIDTLCIDQDNPAEKETQVQRMFDIYQGASEVVLWLGKSYKGSSRGVRAIEWLARFVEDDTQQQLQNDELVARYRKGGKAHKKLKRNKRNGRTSEKRTKINKNWLALCELLDRPYWTRIWVLQEIISRVAAGDKKPCVLQCGRDSLSFHDLGLVLDYFFDPDGSTDVVDQGRSGVELMRGEIFEKYEGLVGHLPSCLAMRTSVNAYLLLASEGLQTMQRMVFMTGTLSATLEQDNIYALLSLLPSSEQAVRPDYRVSMDRMLVNYVQYFVERDGTLDCIFSNRREPCPDDIPSWAPETTRFESADTWHLDSQDPFMAASGDRAADVIFVDDEIDKVPVLRAKGIIVGTINWFIGPNDEHSAANKRVSGATMMYFLNRVQDFGKTLLSDDTEYDKFWRTLCLDGEQLKPGHGLISPAPETLGQASRMRYEKPPDEGFQDHMRPIWNWEDNIGHNTLNRTFFTTECGRIGVGPFGALVGDLVVVLYGSRRLMVLRQREKSKRGYHVVGTAYIYGIMQGEMLGADGVEETVFDLY